MTPRRLLSALIAVCLLAAHTAVAAPLRHDANRPGRTHHRSVAHRRTVTAPARRGARGPAVTYVHRGRPGRRLATISSAPITYYVSPSGTDGAAGSLTAPLRTIDAALGLAGPGDVIQLASGTYPELTDEHARTGWVTITGAGAGPTPTIDGAFLGGSQYLRFVGVRFSSNVTITDSPFVHAAQPSQHIQILNSEVTCGSTTVAPARNGIMLRGGSQDVTLSGDYVHNCVVGFASVAQDAVTAGVAITNCTFENFPGDAIDLGALSNVTIDHNIIRNIADPSGQYHNDGIQFFGNVSNVQITNNVLANSHDQLIFIQDAVQSAITHSSVNSNILVAHNLIYGAGAFAIQTQGAENTRFVANTMWNNHYGSLLLRGSGYTGLAPKDTVVVDNVIQGFGLDGIDPGYEDYNLVSLASAHSGAHDLWNVDPGFVDPANGDFQLLPQSPALGQGSAPGLTSYAAAAAGLGRDLYGVTVSSPVSIGAIQPADPTIGYGAPSYGAPPLR